jgi:hypothetical protein
MEISIGPQWHLLFELILLDCAKPLFQRAELPFYSLDKEKANMRGRLVRQAQQM